MSEFSQNTRGKGGFQSQCKACVSEYRHEYYVANREKISENNRKYHKANREKIAERKRNWYEANRETQIERVRKWNMANREKIAERKHKWYEANREERVECARKWKMANPEKVAENQRKYQSKRKAEDIQFKLAGNLRNRLYYALKGNFKNGSAVRDLGCSIDELKIYLEALFDKGMTWGNYGKWHVDHILPLSSFDLTDREQLLEACHYTNLQPLWAEDNIRKKDKLPGGNNEA